MELPANPSPLVDLLRAWFFAKDRSLVMADNCFIEGNEINTPGNPISGRRRLYAKDDCWYDLDSSGVETSLCGGGLEYAIVVDEKTSGTNGGTFTSGAWRTRDLNTIKLDTIGITLAANQFTLPIGDYIIIASAPAYTVAYHHTRLYNITDAAVSVEGSSEYTIVAYSGSNRSFVIGYFSIAASKTFEFQHRCDSTYATGGLGVASGASFAVSKEVYAQVLLCKI